MVKFLKWLGLFTFLIVFSSSLTLAGDRNTRPRLGLAAKITKACLSPLSKVGGFSKSFSKLTPRKAQGISEKDVNETGVVEIDLSTLPENIEITPEISLSREQYIALHQSQLKNEFAVRLFYTNIEEKPRLVVALGETHIKKF